MNEVTFTLTRREAEIVLLSVQKQSYEIVVDIVPKLFNQYQIQQLTVAESQESS